MTRQRNRPALPADIGRILDMLTWCRPHGSRADRQFRERYLLNLPGARVDAHQNIHVVVGDAPRVLWSCHTDTVHRVPGRQRVEYHDQTMIACLPLKSKSNCLGADDTIGVWLCREMILEGTPGHYVFHYGEESGGIGSRALVRAGEVPKGIDLVIALDRAGTGDVITHQWGGRTCSDAAAWAIAAVLHDADPSMAYAPAHGVYTDSAEYAEDVAECTNLSVGYQGQHTAHETADLGFALRLRDALILANWDAVIPERLPGESEYVSVASDWRTWLDAEMEDTARGALVCRTCGEPAEDDGYTDCLYCGEPLAPDPDVPTWAQTQAEQDQDELSATVVPMWQQRMKKLL